MSAAKNDAQLKNISIADLQKILIKELHSPVLTALDSDVYKKIASTLEQLKNSGCEDIEARVRDRAVALVSLSAESLLRIRLYKIMDAGNRVDYSKLAEEEKYVLDVAGESQRRSNAIISAIKDGRLEILEQAAATVRSRVIAVRFIKPTGQFVGIDLANYGPFKEQETATIPYENARLFIASKAAVQADTI